MGNSGVNASWRESYHTPSLGAELGRRCWPGPWAILMEENLGRLEVITMQGKVSPTSLCVWGVPDTMKLPLLMILHQ